MPPSSLALHEQEPTQAVAPSATACPFTERNDENQKEQQNMTTQQRCHQRQLDRFTSHCRTFYELSTSVHSTHSAYASGHSEGGGNHNGRKQDACPTRQHSKCRAVLEAFDECCRRAHQHRTFNDRVGSLPPQPSPTSTLTDDPSNYDAVRECGLDDPEVFSVDDDNCTSSPSSDPSSSLMLSYVRIRDAERNRAHVVQMLVRRRALLALLRRTEESVEDGRRTDEASDSAAAVSEGDTTPAAIRCVRGGGRHRDEKEFRRMRDCLRVFVAKYKTRVGSHSFLAGLRRILESQVGEDKVLSWTFDGAVLTDNCHGSFVGSGKEGGAGDDAYAEDAVELLTRLFVRNRSDDEVEQENEEGAKEGDEDIDDLTSCPPLTLRYEIPHAVSDGQLRQLAHLLPPERELHCKPTGSLVLTNEERRQHNIDKGLDAKCLEWCSLMLLRWRF